MSTRNEDDSRPGSSQISQRTTLRDAPAARFKDLPAGTVAPRGLRGPSLLPGQGAPERIVPEEVELAVLRDAETQDGPQLARGAKRSVPARETTPSPSPTAVSVEVPRPRSMTPAMPEPSTTPSGPIARSIQSGTLISIGSVDPRAPTELSLPSPRPLSVSERAAYVGPEAVVDRTPRRDLPSVADRDRSADVTLRPGPRSSQPSLRSSSPGFAADASPNRRAGSQPDSLGPASAHLTPRSYSPIATPEPASRRAGLEPPASEARGALSSRPPSAPRFQVHAQLDAVPHEFQDDAFDLRSASTQREPLASRRAVESDYRALERASQAAFRGSDPNLRASRKSAADFRVSDEPPPEHTAPATVARAAAPRATVPLSWVFGLATLAALFALLALLALRAPVAREPVPATEGRASAAPNSAAFQNRRKSDTPSPTQTRPSVPSVAVPRASAPRSAVSGPKSATSARALGSAALPESTGSADPNGKLRSIY